MEVSYSEYHDLVSRIEQLERSDMGKFAIVFPICAASLALLLLVCYFIFTWIDIHKKQ